jgi:peptidoglycan/LPS O-acetylase OafA/YrhL|tara:strand:+ start:2180 stop:3184 length:1005 start_codon:yes stop_codon:yes gene_type:complete
MLKKEYYYSLDLFRGFCGYGVAICHLNAFIFSNQFLEYLSLIFVEFFFVLSGFVLYPQLLKVIDKKNNLLIFYKRRWMRTLPLYVVILILVSILTNHLFDVNFFKYFFLIQKFIPNFIENDYYPVAWSLSIEELFYLLFPLILVFLNNKNFLKISLIIFITIFFIKYSLLDSFDANFYRTGSFLRFDAILFGFLISHFKSEVLEYRKIIILFTIIFITFFLLSHDYFVINKTYPHNRFIFIIFMQLTSGLTLLSFIFLEPLLKNYYLRKFSLLISQQTYSIYLFHIIIIYIFSMIDLSIYIITPIYILLLFLISTLIYNFFEKPLLKLRPKIIN